MAKSKAIYKMLCHPLNPTLTQQTELLHMTCYCPFQRVTEVLQLANKLSHTTLPCDKAFFLTWCGISSFSGIM